MYARLWPFAGIQFSQCLNASYSLTWVLPVCLIAPLDSFQAPAINSSSLRATKVVFNFVIPLLTPCSEEDLYSAAFTFIDNKRAVPASKLLCNSSYNLGFIGTNENLERSVTLQHILFIYESEGWLSITQLFPEHSRSLHYILSSLQKTKNNYIEEITRNHFACCSLLNVSSII